MSIDNFQTKLCCFIHSNECKNHFHDTCKENWKSSQVHVVCDCSCHDHNKKIESGPVKVDKQNQKHTDTAHQMILEDFCGEPLV
jgi:hypothetical protein